MTKTDDHLLGVTHADVEADVRYWEDATIDGIVDEDGSRIPGRNGDTWQVRIRLVDGRIEKWPDGLTARIHYKVCDQGEYWLSRDDGTRVAKWKGHYVPGDVLGKRSGGDYIVMDVDGTGRIVDYGGIAPDPADWPAVA